MFIFDRKLWEVQKARFAESYTNTCNDVRVAGYSEMAECRIPTANCNLPQTTFANGVKITVDFGTTPSADQEGHASGRVSNRWIAPMKESKCQL